MASTWVHKVLSTILIWWYCTTIGYAQLAPYVSVNSPELEQILLQDSLIAQVLKARGGADPCNSGSLRHRVQVIVSVPKLNTEGQVVGLTHKTWGLDTSQYFYPASLVKLPTALVAMEQVNVLSRKHTAATPWTDIAWQDRGGDCRARNSGRHNIANLIKAMALVSDNEAYNTVFRMVGPTVINGRMTALGHEKVQIVKSFDGCAPWVGSRKLKFTTANGLVFTLPAGTLGTYKTSRTAACAQIGKAYWQGGKLVNAPYDFAYHNVVSLPALHNIWCQLIFPQAVPKSGLDISDAQRQDYLRWCTQSPQEGSPLTYANKKLYPTYLKKYLYYGGQPATGTQLAQDSVVSTNVVGQSHGFLADVAHLHIPQSKDARLRAGITVSVVVYVNENEVLNDGIYQYQTLGMPFLRNVGRALWTALEQNKY